jgi:hypothetical protein
MNNVLGTSMYKYSAGYIFLTCSKKNYICEISASHGGEFEAQSLMGCTAVFLIERRPTFQRYVLPQSSERPDDGGSTYL